MKPLNPIRTRPVLAALAIGLTLMTGACDQKTTQSDKGSRQFDTASPKPEVNLDAATAMAEAGAGGLSPLTAKDLSASSLNGELACGFSSDQTGKVMLLVARGDVGRATHTNAIARIEGKLTALQSEQPTGYKGLLDHASFDGPKGNLTLERTGDTPVSRGESPRYPARLTVRWGANKSIVDGFYSCGA